MKRWILTTKKDRLALLENKIFDNDLCSLFLHSFKNTKTQSDLNSFPCEIKTYTNQEHTEIRFIKTTKNNIITLFKDNTENVGIRNDLKTLEQAILKAPIGIMLWDENDKLIIASEKTIKSGKENGFDFDPGVSRIDARKSVAGNVLKSEELFANGCPWISYNSLPAGSPGPVV